MSDEWQQFRNQFHQSFDQPEAEPIHFPPLVDGTRIQNHAMPLPPEIICGLLSQGEKGELAGGSKSFKTWSLIHQALAIAGGWRWWNFETVPTEVIFLNLEIPQAFFEQRVRIVAQALDIKIPQRFHVWHLRSAKLSVPSRWTKFLEELKNHCLGISCPYLTSDPIYKLLGGRNENAAGDVALLLEQLDDMISAVDGSNFFGHHFAKGNQANRDAIDRASGSGVFQRDPDTILVMTPHQKENAFTVETILRNHSPLDPFVVEWNYPLFKSNASLDPGELRQKPGPKPKYSPRQLVELLGEEALSAKELLRRASDELGISRTQFFEVLKRAEEGRFIARDSVAGTWERYGNNSAVH